MGEEKGKNLNFFPTLYYLNMGGNSCQGAFLAIPPRGCYNETNHRVIVPRENNTKWRKCMMGRKKWMAGLLALALLATLVPAALAGSFSDVPQDHWAVGDIESMAEKGF